MAYLDHGQVEKTEELLRLSVGELPEFLPGWRKLAEVWLKQGNQAALRQEAQRLAQREKTRVAGHVLMADLALSKHDTIAARCLERA